MRNSTRLIFNVILLIIVISCREEFEKEGKYDRPGWLAGKLYTQIKSEPDLSVFAKCIELTGYDTIIDISGSYTVFAPDNDAFDLYLQGHPVYASVEDIPLPELKRIVKYHIVQNPWSTQQLKSLDVYGWIDSLDQNNDEPRGYKRETLLRDKDRNFGIQINTDQNLSINERHLIIVDTLQSSWYRKQAMDSRKFVPIFFKEYFDIYGLTTNDYAFYFGRPFENAGDMYFANGRIVKPDIFAENGFIHIIDRVVEPLQNAFQILNTPKDIHSYSKFLDLVNTFPEFTYNKEKTNDQPRAHQGSIVDSLFDITYPELTFEIVNERTKAPAGTLGLPGNVSIRYHHGLIAPTNEAFDEFVQDYLVGTNKWGSIKEAPHHIKRMIVNTHMADGPLYPTDFNRGYYNGENDLITVNQENIIQQQYGSNCTFAGVNKMIVPRAFKSVTGPIYLNRGYSRAMYAIERAGLLPALKRESEEYMLYVESDNSLRVDSSLNYNPLLDQFSVFLLMGGTAQRTVLTTNDLRTLLLNHIAIEEPRGLARKEFLKNLAGNYIIVNNQTGEVRGTAPTTIGYKGLVQTTVIPDQISTNSDNGMTFDIRNWFSFNAPTLYLKISSTYPRFHNLLKMAGLANEREYRYTFLSENENYTVFVPNDAALSNYRYDTLSIPQLRKFLMLHFVQGNLIFTDGRKRAEYYETTRIDEKSTTYTTVYTKIYLDPGPDVINLRNKQGSNYISISESAKTNIITARTLGTGTGAYPMILSNGVIHEIDRVLLYNEVDTK